jgi:DNA-binding MarR family transcriptional regulator
VEHQRTELPALPASLHRRLGAVLSWAAENAQEVANRALEPLGLTVKHFGVVTFLRYETELDRQGGPLSQQAIGERLRIDRTTMVALIDSLERAGYVKRERNPGDRRAYVITLTAARPSARSSIGCSHASSSDPRSGAFGP